MVDTARYVQLRLTRQQERFLAEMEKRGVSRQTLLHLALNELIARAIKK